jgi:hypothetical protein
MLVASTRSRRAFVQAPRKDRRGSDLTSTRRASRNVGCHSPAHAKDPQGKCRSHPVTDIQVAALAQLVRAPDCGSGGPPFEPGRRYQ